MSIRRQASLYLANVPVLEDLRQRFNPAQAALIPAHVTLCREDEVADWGALQKRLESMLPFAIELGFGSPVREGNAVYLPAERGLDLFHHLRCQLLATNGEEPRQSMPHITLIHPRNGICTDEIFQQILNEAEAFLYTFHQVSLIEQSDGGPWKRFATVGSSPD